MSEAAPDDSLTEKQNEVIHHLPADKQELADHIGISPNSVKSRIEEIRSKGVQLEYDRNSNAYYLDGAGKERRVATKHTGSKTREANNWATEQEAVILRRLKNKDPVVAPQTPLHGNEDIVAHFTDLHIGDVVEDEHGTEIYNTQIATQSAEHFTEKTLSLKKRMESVTRFDTLHLLWGGDMVTNENIYDGQAFNIELMLADQMSAAVNALTQQAKSFAEAFDAVQIVWIPGNHGKTRASGVSKQANVDLLTYRWIEDRLAESAYDNIHITGSEATEFANFELRDGQWRGHLRHGQNAMSHIDATAASSRDWRGWQLKHDFDLAYIGHEHVSQQKDVLNQWPVIRSPSPKPGSEFAEKIGHPDCSACRKLGTIHGVSNNRPKTFQYTIDDRDMALPA